jgi:hypothetical protein
MLIEPKVLNELQLILTQAMSMPFLYFVQNIILNGSRDIVNFLQYKTRKITPVSKKITKLKHIQNSSVSISSGTI